MRKSKLKVNSNSSRGHFQKRKQCFDSGVWFISVTRCELDRAVTIEMRHINSFSHEPLRNKNEKSEDYSKADLKQRVLFFITIFRLAIPAFFRFTDVVTHTAWAEQVIHVKKWCYNILGCSLFFSHNLIHLVCPPPQSPHKAKFCVTFLFISTGYFSVPGEIEDNYAKFSGRGANRMYYDVQMANKDKANMG